MKYPGRAAELLHGIDKSQVAGIDLWPDARAGGLDEEDRVIRPTILWNDGRTEETDYLNEKIGKESCRNIRLTLPLQALRHPKYCG